MNDRSEYNKKYYSLNKEKIKLHIKANKDKSNEQRRIRRKVRLDETRAKGREDYKNWKNSNLDYINSIEYKNRKKEIRNKSAAKYRVKNKEKIKISQKHFRDINVDKRKLYNKQYNITHNHVIKNYLKLTKDAAFNAYGGYKCVCCGETLEKFLTLDHINNDGNKHRKSIKTNTVYGWLKKNKYPSGFQILCFNCNIGRSLNNNICPHTTNLKEIKLKRAQSTKDAAYAAYGGYKCSCCGVDYHHFLTLDHIYNDGSKHRKENKITGGIYAWAKKNGYPKILRVLCWNCNVGRRHNNNSCPHQL